MSIEAPKPQRDPELYDEHGRVIDSEIARPMAEAEESFRKDKAESFRRAAFFEKGKVGVEMDKKEANLRNWMETVPEKIRDKNKKEEESELLRSGPSLLSPEEEAKLWERFEKLVNVKVEDEFLRTFKTGEGYNLPTNENDTSLEDVATLLESLDRVSSSVHKRQSERDFGDGFWILDVKHKNGKTSESVICTNNSRDGKFGIGIYGF